MITYIKQTEEELIVHWDEFDEEVSEALKKRTNERKRKTRKKVL